MIHSKIESAPSHPTPVKTDDPTLTGKLHSLTADERFEMEQAIRQYGEAYVLANWTLILEQIRYILML